MSQTELHQLLYAALASGSMDSQDHYDTDSATDRQESELSEAATPQDIIAHYDFRVRQQKTL